MKKFEEEFDKNIDVFHVIGCHNGMCCSVKEVKAFGKDWVSPEDHQAEVTKLKNEINWLHNLLDGRNEEVLQTVKQLNEAIPEIPEVPKEVANIYEKHKDQHHKLSVILEELYVNTFATFGSSLTQGEVDDIVVAMRTNGYTVAKEKRFYLKHIDMSKKYNSTVCVLAHGEGDVIYGHYEFPVGVFPSESDYIFTQSQIDSMETGSYEQIEVQE